MAIRHINELEYRLIGKSPEYCMKIIMGSYSGPTKIVPEPNKYYTFVYTAKTKGIQYDQHPLILCGSLFPWGFTGENVHWNSIRRYTWAESSNLLELNENEFKTLMKLPLARFKVA